MPQRVCCCGASFRSFRGRKRCADCQSDPLMVTNSELKYRVRQSKTSTVVKSCAGTAMVFAELLRDEES
jgi:hypothetical protein